MNTLLRDGELSFTSDLGNGETPNLKKLLRENKARDVVTYRTKARQVFK
jgi:hypothetical protein